MRSCGLYAAFLQPEANMKNKMRALCSVVLQFDGFHLKIQTYLCRSWCRFNKFSFNYAELAACLCRWSDPGLRLLNITANKTNSGSFLKASLPSVCLRTFKALPACFWRFHDCSVGRPKKRRRWRNNDGVVKTWTGLNGAPCSLARSHRPPSEAEDSRSLGLSGFRGWREVAGPGTISIVLAMEQNHSVKMLEEKLFLCYLSSSWSCLFAR